MKILTILMLLFLLLFLSSCEKSYDERTTNFSNDDIALISVYASKGLDEKVFGLMNLGHSFISIQNISDDFLDVAGYSLAPEATITIGTWSILKKFGVWYNVETNYIYYRNKYSDRISVTSGLTESEFQKLTDYIKTKPTWSILRNCSYFEIHIWNVAAEANETLEEQFIYTPSELYDNIERFTNHEHKKQIPLSGDIGYFKGDKFIFYKMEKEND